MIRRGSTHIFITRRADLAAPGTRLIALRTSNPSLAIRDYMLRGFKNEAEEKLFCIWLNSTPFLVEMLGRATITRGSWLLFDLFALDNVRFPDITKLDASQIKLIADGYDRIKGIIFSPLIEQLKNHKKERMILDDIILKLLGVKNGEKRMKISLALQTGASEAIHTLQNTMILDSELERE